MQRRCNVDVRVAQRGASLRERAFVQRRCLTVLSMIKEYLPHVIFDYRHLRMLLTQR